MIAIHELSTPDLQHLVASVLNELHERDECPGLDGDQADTVDHHAETIADRAREAYRFVQRHSGSPQVPRHRAQDAARAAVRLSGILNVGIGNVHINRSWARGLGPAGPLTLVVSDPGGEPSSYTFSCRNPMYADEPFHLLGPSPECCAMVPLIEIQQLADLSDYFVNGTTLFSGSDGAYHVEFAEDSRHTHRCCYGAIQG